LDVVERQRPVANFREDQLRELIKGMRLRRQTGMAPEGSLLVLAQNPAKPFLQRII